MIEKLTDVGHAVYGWICAMLVLFGSYLAGAMGFMSFAVYQYFDYLKDGNLDEVCGDVKEFCSGVAAAVIYYALKVVGVPVP